MTVNERFTLPTKSKPPLPFLFFEYPHLFWEKWYSFFSLKKLEDMPQGTITSVRQFTSKSGKAKVYFKVKDEKGVVHNVYLSESQVEVSTGVSAKFHVLRGSEIDWEYFDKGEELANGEKCTDDGIIVKDFDFILSERLQTIDAAANKGFALFA